MALFGTPPGRGGLSAGPKPLLEFRAGKMTMGEGNLVTPDKRKGLVQIEHGADDQLMHFKWKERHAGSPEDDLIIFPDDIDFKRVAACTTGRVYVLRFKNSPKRMFFWMQEPKEDKDDEYCKKVNDLLNHPPAPGSAAARGGSGGAGSGGGGAGAAIDLANMGDADISSLLSNMNQQQLMQLLNGASGSGLASLLGADRGPPSGSSSAATPTAAASSSSASARQRAAARRGAAASSTPPSSAGTSSASTGTTTAAASQQGSTASAASKTPAGGAQAIQLSDLQNILSGLNVPKDDDSGPNIDLSSGLTAEAMKPLLQDKAFVAGMKELLPPEHDNQDLEVVANEINYTVQSPQFQQALSTFSSALQTGQLAPLIRNFKLGDDAVNAAAKGDMESFVKAVIKHQENEKKKDATGQQQEPKKKDDEPEDMALD